MIVHQAGEPISQPLCLMIGNFDGVHLGHQRILAQAADLAQTHQCATAVLSFQPHPLKVLQPERAPLLLQTTAQKQALLAYHGVHHYIAQPFTENLYTLSPQAFVEHLVARLHIRHVLVGFNFRFGFQRSGCTETLRAMEKEHGFQTWVVDPATDATGPISSSRIRALVTEGAMDEAAQLLGRPYFLEGQVGHGVKLGRDLRTPTANFSVSNECKPKYGVYATWCRLEGRWFRAITNFGEAPTIGRHVALCESHLLGFDGHLYDKHLVVVFGQLLRPEQTFPSVDALKQQIQSDVAKRIALPDQQPPVLPLALDPKGELP